MPASSMCCITPPITTRWAFCARYADRPVAVLGTHFHHPTAGWIVSDRAGWRFSVDARREPGPPQDRGRP